MPHSLRCPACSAPLDLPEAGAATAECPYCGVGVLLGEAGGLRREPANERHAEAVAAALALLRQGSRAQAVQAYRLRLGVGLGEARDAVARIAAGQPAGMLPASTHPARPVALATAAGLLVLVVAGGVVAVSRGGSPPPPVPAPALAPTPLRAAPPPPVAAPAEPAAFAAEVLRFGSEGTGAGRFRDARAVATDGAGRIYVGEYSGGRVQVFDSAGAFLTQWMADARMPLRDLEAGRDGTVFVVQRGRIRRFEGPTGRELSGFGGDGSYDDVALALDGSVVAVSGLHHVVHLGPDGRVRTRTDLRRAVGEDASPGHVAVAGTGEVFVLDRWTGEVYRLNADGRFVDRFGGRGEGGAGMRAPQGIAVDGRGRVLVSDLIRGIFVYAPDGTELGRFGGPAAMFGIAVDGRDQVFVSDRNDHQVVKFRMAR